MDVKQRGKKGRVKTMYEYEKKLQEALLQVIESHKPTNSFDFGIQIGYLHAIARANISGRCPELEDKLFTKMQEYRNAIRK